MIVLGIESSCDETGVALYSKEQGLIAHALYSQVKLHQQYGGVVPELASRDHVKHLLPLINNALTQAQLRKHDVSGIAYTAGPGLIGALLTGACFAKSLAYALNIPAFAVHHLEAHILAAMLEDPNLKFPFIALLVSGGHTQLIKAESLGHYQLLGDTLDDAVGEAFDKTAKVMGITYPGGAKLADLADHYAQDIKATCPVFPRPMTDRPGCDFSFSGLKTHALTYWNKSKQDKPSQMEIAYAFQEAVVSTLAIKCKRALHQTGIKTLVVAGGVGANGALRQTLNTLVKTIQGQVFFPSIEYCTDNGAMIAYAGFLYLQQGYQDPSHEIEVRPRWPLTTDKHRG